MTNTESVKAFLQKSRRPMHFADIAKALGLTHAQARSLKKSLRILVLEGEVVRLQRGQYALPMPVEILTGILDAHEDGFGFVILDKPGERDVFVPARDSMDAMDGDRVSVRITESRRRAGRIVKVISRGLKRISGTLQPSPTGPVVMPRRRSVGPIAISDKSAISIAPGERVLVEITSHQPLSGKLIRELPAPETPAQEIEAIIDEQGLPKRFPHEAKVEAANLKGSALGQRTDLRHLITCTIDGERARDFDDAVSIESAKDGYTLYVHIADVGHYVTWGCALDQEALRRGTSTYFPDRVIPMLPKELSEDLCSLKPNEDRPTITVQMAFTPQGSRKGVKLYESLIHSNARMTYTSVAKVIVEQDPKEREKYAHLTESLDMMSDLAHALRDRRLKRGSLDFDLPEPEVVLDIQGNPEGILKAARNFAHMLIEEFMIAANEAVAQFLFDKGIPSMYRIHEEPDAEKIEQLLEMARVPAKRGRVPKADDISKLLATLKGKPYEEAVNYMVLKSLKQARYSMENYGHFGLASKCYTHFTSPIRRYPDLVVHRILREVLTEKRLSTERIEELKSILPDMAAESSRLERVSEAAERDAVNVFRMWFMMDKVGEQFTGRVSGLSPFSLRIRLDEYFVEGTIPLSTIKGDVYVFDARSATLKGRRTGKTFSIGSPVNVSIDKVNIKDRELLMGLVKAG